MPVAACGGWRFGSVCRAQRSGVGGGRWRGTSHPEHSAGPEAAPRYRRRRSEVFRLGRRLALALPLYRQHPSKWSQPRRGWASPKNYAEGALTRAPPNHAGAPVGRRRRLDASRPRKAAVGRLRNSEGSGCGKTCRWRWSRRGLPLPSDRGPSRTASERRRDGCGWLPLNTAGRRQAPDTSSRRDAAVDCRTAGWVDVCASVRWSSHLVRVEFLTFIA